MPFRKKIRRLINRCQLSQSRCDVQIAGLSREIQELISSKESIQVQIEGLRLLLKTQRVNAEILNREQLNAMLRKQSVLRRKIYECNTLISQIIEQCKELEEKRIELQKKRQYWLRKEENYNRWLSKQKQQIYLFDLRQDEVEQEERIQWNL
ncbi:SPI-1 type III secretion system protein SpaM [Providencia alcalifaciens]|uniref:SPI-1 type III secretion system protein SpaM n=1 Tax=Providencia alcalifaciens TaxID=126385 RepID=UPI0032DA53AC